MWCLLPGGGAWPGPGGVCVVSAPGGWSAPGRVSAPGGGTCLVGGGVVSGLGGSAPGGMSGRGGVCLSTFWDTTPPPREQNDKQVQKYYLGHNFVAAGNYIVV